jgi:hypothetical protein
VNGNQADDSAGNSGAAYVFVRSGSTWTQQAYLKASNTGAGDQFGFSVAVSGNTVVVGAYTEDSNATGVNGNEVDDSAAEAGAVYVFVRSGSTWTQQAYLKASNTEAGDSFGFHLAISGDTLLIGAYGEDSNATGVDGSQADNSTSQSGAAYVFTRSGSTWTQQAYLKASNTWASDRFGRSVAVSGDTAVIGAYLEDSSAIGVGGNQADDSTMDAGAAYVFVRSGSTWMQQAYLKAHNTGELDQFGRTVAVAGDTVVVGATGEDSNATGVDGNGADDSAADSGAAYVFTRSGSTWTPQAYLKASNTGAGDIFGSSVVVAGGTVVIGATGEDSSATGVNGNQADDSAIESGAAYTFTRSGSTWTQQAYLKATKTGTGDAFGCAVAVSGDTTVIGARTEDSNATEVNGSQTDNSTSNAGAAYVFTGFGPPDIAVSQSTALTDSVGGVDFGAAVVGTSTPLTFTITNPGSAPLTNLAVTKDGLNAGDFTVSALSGTSIPVGVGTVTFTVTFSPSGAGAKTTAIHIVSNATGTMNPFDIALSGQALSSANDTDGDGLNDASEFQMSALGFNWQVNQSALVNTLFSNANGAGLFTTSQVHALHLDVPLIQRDANGQVKLTIGVEKSTTLLPGSFQPFPMTAPQTTINGAGKLEFYFASPNQAEFYRIEVSH